MIRKLLEVSSILAFVTTFAVAADTGQVKAANLSATEIVSQNIAARGGLQAWRSVQTLSWTGKLGVGGNRRVPVPQVPAGKKAALLPTDPRPSDETVLPFKMDMQRPRKVRMEILFNGQTAVQIYDGVNGWKLRPYLNRLEVEPFTADESRLSSMQEELDGPLVDYAAKGAQVELDGMGKVDDQNAYKIKLTKKDGHTVHVWIDAKTFLEAKIEGQPRRLDGVEHPVEVYYRDYRTVNGLQIPFVLETRVLPAANAGKGFNDVPPQAEKITIDKVEINPKLDASLFMKPQVQTATNQH
jgi:outer membrane lipoprotein-sorting protein